MSLQSTWRCPQGHEVTGDRCPWDGTPRPEATAGSEATVRPEATLTPGAAGRPEATAGSQATASPGGPGGPWGPPVPGSAAGANSWEVPTKVGRKLPTGAIVAIVVAGVLVIGGFAAGIALVAVGISGSSGFNNTATLAGSIQHQANGKLAAQGESARITSVSCSHLSGTQYTCDLQGSDGSTGTVAVTVASDGNSYFTTGSS